MLKYFIIRDKRLAGNLPSTVGSALITSEVDATTPLSTAFLRVNTAAKLNGKLKTLFLLCHGIEASWGNFRFGGKGLELGQERLLATNVNNWTAIKDAVDFIVVYACSAAYTGMHSPPQSTVVSDGQALMSNLAKNTNASVFAANRTQWYNPHNFDFGKWEGTVFQFLPSGHVVPNIAPSKEVWEIW